MDPSGLPDATILPAVPPLGTHLPQSMGQLCHALETILAFGIVKLPEVGALIFVVISPAQQRRLEC